MRPVCSRPEKPAAFTERRNKFRLQCWAAVLILLLCCGCTAVDPQPPPPPPAVIFDTDISSDVDDVGAVAVLHALADRGRLKILATMVSSGDPWSAACLDALNTHFGRPDTPLGVVRGGSVVHESTYTRIVATEFPHDTSPTVPPEDAVVLYRRLLADNPDHSVTIVTVGYLTNLRNLMESPADEISDLNGRSLVQQKVKLWVCMGGRYPKGREWNFYQDASATLRVVPEWPGPVAFIGYEIGVQVMTGKGLAAIDGPSPVKRGYQLYNRLENRPSWDQLAVLYVSQPGQNETAQNWITVNGRNRIYADGSNEWLETGDGSHAYIRLKAAPETLAAAIEELMMHPPAAGTR